MTLEVKSEEFEKNIIHFDDLLLDNDFKDKTILYFTSDIPIEIISAAGLHPVRIPSDFELTTRQKSIDSIIQPFNCSKSRQMLDFIINFNGKKATKCLKI